MFELKRALLAAVLSAAAVVAVAVPTATADEPKVKKPEPPAAEPAKTIIIQIDASKLPPDVLKELLKLSKPTEPMKPATKPEPVKPGTKPEPVKPGVKPEPTKPGIKPDTKPVTKPVKAISLSDAIAIAEKLTKGTVVKAEREDEDGKVEFELEVVDGKGGKTKITLDASGQVLESKKKGEKEDDKDEKGKKKKDD
jgi:hypothetical protein